MYSNVQSFLSKKSEIEAIVAENNFEILFFTEVWLTEDHSDCEISIKGFQAPVICKKNRGGTCIFVKEDIPFYEVTPPNPCEDSSWIVINSRNNVKRVYACIYRSPNSTPENNRKLV